MRGHSQLGSADNQLYFATDSQLKHAIQLRQFLETTTLTVLFIFGPSGCGKRTFLLNMLSTNRIPFQEHSEHLKYSHGDISLEEPSWVSLGQILGDILSNSGPARQVNIFSDLPLDNNGILKIPRHQFHRLVSSCSQKCIFLLNSQIYNPFFILGEGQRARTSNLPNVIVLKFKQYGVRESKAIIQLYQTKYRAILDDSGICNDIIERADGDARKLLMLADWHVKVVNKTNNPSKNKVSKKQLQHQRTIISHEDTEHSISLFHMLGKFLYAKRQSVPFDYKKPSKIYSAEQLRKIDPPFYFDPLALYRNSRLSFSLFCDYLQQNYVHKYTKLTDICNFYQVLCLSDSLIQFSAKVRDKQAVDQLLTVIVSWGVILYNRNPKPTQNLLKFGRSMLRATSKKQLQFEQLIKKHFGSFPFKVVLLYGALKKQILNQVNDPLVQLMRMSFKSPNVPLTEEKQKVDEEEEFTCDFPQLDGVDAVMKKQARYQALIDSLYSSEESDIDDIDQE